MPDFAALQAKVASVLSAERYAHTLRVVQQAQVLAAAYNADPDAARVAAILHDCAKDLPIAVQLKQAEAFGIVLAEVERHTPALLHALVGAAAAQREYGVTDAAVLSAIRWHTTGRANMTTLEKVIFLADYTEVGRQFAGVHAVREAAGRDLDEAMLIALDQTITHVLQKNWLLHPVTVEARNFLLLQREQFSADLA